MRFLDVRCSIVTAHNADPVPFWRETYINRPLNRNRVLSHMSSSVWHYTFSLSNNLKIEIYLSLSTKDRVLSSTSLLELSSFTSKSPAGAQSKTDGIDLFQSAVTAMDWTLSDDLSCTRSSDLSPEWNWIPSRERSVSILPSFKACILMLTSRCWLNALAIDNVMATGSSAYSHYLS